MVVLAEAPQEAVVAAGRALPVPKQAVVVVTVVVVEEALQARGDAVQESQGELLEFRRREGLMPLEPLGEEGWVPWTQAAEMKV